MAVLGPRFCARAFSSCGKRGPLLIAVRGPLTIAASPGSRRAGSAIVAHGPSRSAARGILPDQGSNPCALHWQADSQPPRHQGSPVGRLLDKCQSNNWPETCCQSTELLPVSHEINAESESVWKLVQQFDFAITSSYFTKVSVDE